MTSNDLSVLKKPDTIDIIYKHMANGGSILDLSELWKIRFSDLMHWIHTDATRKQLYDDAIQAQTEFVVRRVLKEVQRIATADVRGAYKEDGTLKKMSDIPDDVAATISAVETVDYFEGNGKDREQVGWIRKVKFWSKPDAIKMLMQHLGMLVERVEHSGKLSLEKLIEQAEVIDATVVPDESIGSREDATTQTLE